MNGRPIDELKYLNLSGKAVKVISKFVN